jgi:DNA-binding NarL/FixJ family response regulator
MTRVFLADNRTDERSALHLLLMDMKLELVGEATDWATTLAELPASRAEMLIVDWDLLPGRARTALEGLRETCSAPLTVVLLSPHDAHLHAALASGADLFVSKLENAERLTESVRLGADGYHLNDDVH